MLLWLSVWSEVQIVCIWSSWCRCHPKTPSSLTSLKSRLVLHFWYWLTQVILEKRLLNGCSLVVVVVPSWRCLLTQIDLYNGRKIVVDLCIFILLVVVFVHKSNTCPQSLSFPLSSAFDVSVLQYLCYGASFLLKFAIALSLLLFINNKLMAYYFFRVFSLNDYIAWNWIYGGIFLFSQIFMWKWYILFCVLLCHRQRRVKQLRPT